MANFLAGMQYADRKKAFPTWTDSEADIYYEWKDVTTDDIIFAGNTRIRMKPEYDYRLTVNNGSPLFFASKDTLMSAVAQHVTNGDTIEIGSSISSRSKRIDKLQALVVSRDGDWLDFSLGSTPIILQRPTIFRIRPDHYHVVDSIDPVVKGSLDFHDVEKLAAYVDKRIRTNGLDFSVRKVKYDN